jgi:hypothetical protein
MRLFEVEDRFINDLETLLRNQVGRSDSQSAPQILSYPALSNLLKNMGYGAINFDILSQIFDSNPQLQPLIADFDQEKIVLGTRQATPNTGSKLDVPDGPSVDQMASSGAAAHMKQISK